MKTSLPESRNRNLPPPPAEGAPVRRRMPPGPPPEPREGPSALRSLIVLIIIVGLFGSGIYFYIRSARNDAKVQEQLAITLTSLGHAIWVSGMSLDLATTTEDEAKDLADLPRIIAEIKIAAGKLTPRVKVIEGDPPPGKGNATHQIMYSFNDRPLLIIRVRCFPDSGRVEFLGEVNRVVPSRREYESQSKSTEDTPAPAATIPAPPAPVETPAPTGAGETATPK